MGEAKDRQSRPERRKAADSGSEFFAVGTPLHAVRASYIRRPADELFFEALLTGRYAHVIAPDQSGKTSLIAATAERLKANGAKVAVLDLAQLVLRDSGNDAGRFYYSVAFRILRQLRIKFELQPWWQDKAMLSNRQRLHEFYSEIILGETKSPVVILIDEVQCVEGLPFTDQLLTSARSAHDARTTDPEFTRLTFALCGECDPAALVDAPEASPFQVTRSIPLRDFTREEIGQYGTELNIPAESARVALDRIYHWTGGQPYLTQKLARAVSREAPDDDIDAFVDGIVAQQFTGRASLSNEPLLKHVQGRILNDPRRDQLLNLYGRLRKGVEVATDLGSPLQRRLIALGLVIVNESGDLEIRNRIYREVFTARWANENLRIDWRVPVVAVLALAVFLAVPFWYTQWLPKAYLSTLMDSSTPLDVAETTWTNLRSFPGHTDSADHLYRLYIEDQARRAETRNGIEAVAARAAALDDDPGLPGRLLAAFQDRAVSAAIREEERDQALLASLEALRVPSPERRRRAAMLVGEDYPSLLASLTVAPVGLRSIDSATLAITDIDGAAVRQWTMTPGGLRRAEPWNITALEVTPIVRRVIVDREGAVRRASLSLSLSHGRHTDLRIKVIAPSGKAVEIETGRERSSVVDEIRIPSADLAGLVGEPLSGTWSLSIRDEEIGVAGHLVGWNLTLNTQGLVEDFQRGIDIPDPVEVEASNVWISEDGRYAVARATQSDNARVWDLAFAKPVRAIALNQSETLIGLDAGARRLITATPESVNLWDTATGDRLSTLPVQGGGLAGRLTDDGRHLFLNYPGDAETRFELWSLESGTEVAALTVAGTPALVALDADGRRLAVADFDRSVRVWDFREDELLTQLNLAAQPSEIRLSAGGEALGAVYGRLGLSLWSLTDGGRRLFERLGAGNWRMAFSPSGTRVLAGRTGTGFRVYDATTGIPLGAAIGVDADPSAPLAFSLEEDTFVTGGPESAVRFWQAPLPGSTVPGIASGHAFWQPAPGHVAAATPDIRKLLVGDAEGHLHVIPLNATPAELAAAAAKEVNYLGHSAPVVAVTAGETSLWAATAAEDGTLRAWGLVDGLPEPWVAQAAPGVVDLEFSPDSRLLAVLDGAGVLVVDRDSGEFVTRYAHASPLSSMAFVTNDTLYAGAADGLLLSIRLRRGAPPEIRRLWQGTATLTHVARGPWEGQLIVVDATDTARVLSVEDGAILPRTLTLPAPVTEIAVAPIGADVLFRTERWVHRAQASRGGLIWSDATLIEPAQSGQRLFFESGTGGHGQIGTPLILTGASSGIGLATLDAAAGGPGLFGSHDELLADWRRRLGLEAPGGD